MIGQRMTKEPTIRGLLLGYALALGAAPVSGQVSGRIPEWTLERGVTIGSVDDPVYGLSGDVRVLADAERLFVLQPQDGNVRVFSHTGEFVRDLGRRGEGPGELMQPSGMGRYGARLWVKERISARLTFFDVATGEAETTRYGADVPGSLNRWLPFAVLANGRFVASPAMTTGPGGGDDGFKNRLHRHGARWNPPRHAGSTLHWRQHRQDHRRAGRWRNTGRFATSRQRLDRLRSGRIERRSGHAPQLGRAHDPRGVRSHETRPSRRHGVPATHRVRAPPRTIGLLR
ncbi:MAG: 6-bladed beta-propeller [Gemmatimonadales bacterium]|nr:6-bladed beta-propeller [Gemmatimonadales bacterium]MYG49801.1 6-bladed beta-propeller [Gemmatimonadales bacterium]MYK02437.1 6-bladed beta-propeller [Candidatus Palauibacter ramosifaciens]